MAPQPPRREQRRTHLDASVVPVERALIARAAYLQQRAANVDAEVIVGIIDRRMAREFLDLAEELRYW